MRKNIFYYILAFLLCSLISCKKYLDKVSDISLALPTSLEDFQRLLDRNENVDNSTMGVGDLSSDDYYLDSLTLNSMGTIQRNCYQWTNDIWEGQNANDWSNPYSIIYHSNVVLDGLDAYELSDNSDETKKNTIRGHALFLRGYEHYTLQETFGVPFNASTANTDLGVPLKLSSVVSNNTSRATVLETFNQIIKDLEQAAILLPKVTITKNRPSKAAAYAMLARVYLSLQDFAKAGMYADKALQINNILFDYNDLITSATNPFSSFAPPNDLPEIYYTSYQVGYGVIRLATTNIDSSLFNSYNENDLRKSAFYRLNASTNTYYFKGNYSGSALRQFSGLATDEMYLTRAEAKARSGNVFDAMEDLNTLLEKRWASGHFIPYTANSVDEALTIILQERRKELIFRGLRWIDLRRLNKEAKFAITLTRRIHGQMVVLPPQDLRYTFLIPTNEIQINGLKQNARQ